MLKVKPTRPSCLHPSLTCLARSSYEQRVPLQHTHCTLGSKNAPSDCCTDCLHEYETPSLSTALTQRLTLPPDRGYADLYSWNYGTQTRQPNERSSLPDRKTNRRTCGLSKSSGVTPTACTVPQVPNRSAEVRQSSGNRRRRTHRLGASAPLRSLLAGDVMGMLKRPAVRTLSWVR